MGENLSELRKIRGYELLWAIVGFLAVAGPGFLTLYQFHPNLIKELEFSKLIVFSLALCLPVLFVQTMLIAVSRAPGQEPTKAQALISSAFGTCMTMYGSLLIAYLYHLSFRWFLIWIAIFTAIVALIEKARPSSPPDKTP